MTDVTIIRHIIEQGLQDIYKWYTTENTPFLKSIFSVMGFKGDKYQTGDYYLPPISLLSPPPLPVKKTGDKCRIAKQAVLQDIRENFNGFSGS